MIQLNPEQRNFILESAIQAPSADNHHRIRFQVEADTISIRYTEKILPQGGYKRVLALLSLGAMVENLSIAARRFSLEAQATLIPDPSRFGLAIKIRLLPTKTAADPLWHAIPQRHTNRRIRYRGPKLNAVESSALDIAVSVYPSSQLIWLDQPAQRTQALRLMRRAETARFQNQVLHEELFSAIRFDIGWHTTCEEDLPPGALAVEPPMRPLFALLRHWPVMRLANLLGTHHLLGLRACDLPCRLAPHLGLLAVRNTGNQAVFDTGRAFQRLWLTLTVQGRVLQPLPASALYALEGAQAEGIPLKLQQRLAESWKASLGNRIPLILFRIGFAPPTLITAGRPQLGEFMDPHPRGIS